MNVENSPLLKEKFLNMERNMGKLEKKLDKGFDEIKERLDKQEDKFVSKDQHKLVVSNLGILNKAAGFILTAIGTSVIIAFFSLILK